MGKVKVVDVLPELKEEVKEEVVVEEPKEEVKEEVVVEEPKEEVKTEVKEEVKPKPKRAPPKPKVAPIPEPPPAPPPTPEPEPPKKEKTGDKIVTCDKCNKSMKFKSFKYSHKCDGVTEKHIPPKQEQPIYKPNPIQSFNDFRVEHSKQIEFNRNLRTEQRLNRVKSLIAQAI
jgi:hypothetical protein